MVPLVKILSLSILYLILAITSVTEGSCWRYGHSCWGGHGKRSGPSSPTTTNLNHINGKPEKPSPFLTQVSTSSLSNSPPKYGLLNSMGLLLRERESKKGFGLRVDEKINIIDPSIILGSDLNQIEEDDDEDRNSGKEVDVFIIEKDGKFQPNESGNEYMNYQHETVESHPVWPDLMKEVEEEEQTMESEQQSSSHFNDKEDETRENEINTLSNKFFNPSSSEDQRSLSHRNKFVVYNLIIPRLNSQE